MRRRSAVQLYLMTPAQHQEYLRRRERITSRYYTLSDLHRAARLAGGVTAGDPDQFATELREGMLYVVCLPRVAAVEPAETRTWRQAARLAPWAVIAMAAGYLAWHAWKWLAA